MFNTLKKKTVAGLVVAAVAASAFAGTSYAETSPDAAIKYRKSAMKAVGGHIGGLVGILKGDAADRKGGLAAIAAGLAAATDLSITVPAFKQNTAGLGTEKTTTTPKTWEDFARFEKALTDMNNAAKEISLAASKGELTSFDQLKPALAQCGFCHRESGFRSK